VSVQEKDPVEAALMFIYRKSESRGYNATGLSDHLSILERNTPVATRQSHTKIAAMNTRSQDAV